MMNRRAAVITILLILIFAIAMVWIYRSIVHPLSPDASRGMPVQVDPAQSS